MISGNQGLKGDVIIKMEGLNENRWVGRVDKVKEMISGNQGLELFMDFGYVINIGYFRNYSGFCEDNMVKKTYILK